MPRHGEIVIGPAGCGKSTYCALMQEFAENKRRTVKVINMDPAAGEGELPYKAAIDIRSLIDLNDVVEELNYGPNGGLVFAMEYIADHLDLVIDCISEFDEEDHLIFDFPGQIELYIHLPTVRKIISTLSLSLDMQIVVIHCIDVAFVLDTTKIITGCLLSLSSMLSLELPHISVLTKCDMLPEGELLENILEVTDNLPLLLRDKMSDLSLPYKSFITAITDVLDEHSLVTLIPCNARDPDTLDKIFTAVACILQTDENREVQLRDMDEAERHMEAEVSEINYTVDD